MQEDHRDRANARADRVRWWTRWRAGWRLAADRRGLAAVQFAFAAPVLLLFIIGTIEIAIVLFVGGAIEAAALAS